MISRGQMYRQLYQQGGEIMPRLNQLGNNVSSAEQTLQQIKQRLQSAESTLGSGGGTLASAGPFMGQPSSLSADVATSAGISPGPQVNKLPAPYDQRGLFNAQDAYAAAQKEAQKTRGGGFLGQVVLPGEMSFEDFSNNFSNFNNFGQPMPLPTSGGLGGGMQPAVSGLAGIYQPRQSYMGGGIGSLEAGAPSIKYEGDIRPQMASAPDPAADLYDQFLNMKSQGIIPMNMSFSDFQELLREQSSSQGGIMDMVPREKALFGGIKKAVKKVTGAVKDVVSSDLGKAALLYAGTAGLGSLGAGGGFSSLFKLGTYAPSTVLANLGATATRFNPFSKSIPSVAGGIDEMVNKGLGKGVSTSMLATLGIAGTSVLASLSTADKEEIDQADPSDRGKIVKEKLRQSLTNLGYTGEELETKLNEGVSEYFGANMAVGGRVMKAYGDTASMASGIEGLPMRTNQAGVNELDLRNTGGFIPPVGIKEKADDIPAMLSNNEFVFTADAVRAAGGGSVEKGAQKMYDLMKSLEGKIA